MATTDLAAIASRVASRGVLLAIISPALRGAFNIVVSLIGSLSAPRGALLSIGRRQDRIAGTASHNARDATRHAAPDLPEGEVRSSTAAHRQANRAKHGGRHRSHSAPVFPGADFHPVDWLPLPLRAQCVTPPSPAPASAPERGRSSSSGESPCPGADAGDAPSLRTQMFEDMKELLRIFKEEPEARLPIAHRVAPSVSMSYDIDLNGDLYYSLPGGPIWAKIESRKCLLTYCSSLREALCDDKMLEKIVPGGKDRIEHAITETLAWFNFTQIIEVPEMQQKAQALSDIITSVLRMPANDGELEVSVSCSPSPPIITTLQRKGREVYPSIEDAIVDLERAVSKWTDQATPAPSTTPASAEDDAAEALAFLHLWSDYDSLPHAQEELPFCTRVRRFCSACGAVFTTGRLSKWSPQLRSEDELKFCAKGVPSVCAASTFCCLRDAQTVFGNCATQSAPFARRV